MATQEKSATDSRGQSDRIDGGPVDATQRDHWTKYVESLSQQFGEAIDPVLAELPQRMAKAIGANLTNNGEQVARNMPDHSREPTEAPESRRIGRAGAQASDRGDDDTDGRSPENHDRGDIMARTRTSTEEREAGNRGDGNGSEERRTSGTSVERRTKRQGRQDQGRDSERRGGSGRPGYRFDAIAASRAELIRLAASWSEAGAPFQAIHMYTRVLDRYPNSGAAVAAAEELLKLAETMQQQGMYFTAAGILDKLYRYS